MGTEINDFYNILTHCKRIPSLWDTAGGNQGTRMGTWLPPFFVPNVFLCENRILCLSAIHINAFF